MQIVSLSSLCEAMRLALKKSKISSELKNVFTQFLKSFPDIEQQAEYMLVDKKIKIETIIEELYGVPLDQQLNWKKKHAEAETKKDDFAQLSNTALALSDVEATYQARLLFKDWKQEHGFESVPPEIGDIHTFIRFEYAPTKDQQDKFLWTFIRCRLGKRGWGGEKLLKSLSKSLLDNNNNPGWTVKRCLEEDPWLADKDNNLRTDLGSELPNPLLLSSRNTHGLLFLLLGHPFFYYKDSQQPLKNSFEKLRFSLQVYKLDQHRVLAGSLIRVGKSAPAQRISTEMFAEEGVMLEGLPKAALFQEKYYEISPTPLPASMIRGLFSGVIIPNAEWPEFLKEWQSYYSENLLESTQAELPNLVSRQFKEWHYWLVAPDTSLPENKDDESLANIKLTTVNEQLVSNSLAVDLKNAETLKDYWQAKLSPKTLLLFQFLHHLSEQKADPDGYYVLERQNASSLLILSEDYPYAYGKNRRRIIKKSALKFSIAVQRNPKNTEQYLLQGKLWQKRTKGGKQITLEVGHRVIGLVPSFVLDKGQLVRIESMVSGRLVSDLLSGVVIEFSEISDFYVTALPHLRQRNIRIEDPEGLLRVSALYNYTIQGQMRIWEVNSILMGRLEVIMRTDIQDFEYEFFTEADEFTTTLDGNEYQIPKNRQEEQRMKNTLYEHGWVDEGDGEYSMLIKEAMHFVLDVLPNQETDGLIKYVGKKQLKKWSTRKVVPQFKMNTQLSTDWFDLELGIEYGDQKIPLERIIELWKSGTNAFEDPKGDGIIELDEAWLGKFAPVLYRLAKSNQQNTTELIESANAEADAEKAEADNKESLRVERYHVNLVYELEQAALEATRNETWKDLLVNIQSFKGIKKQPIPSLIKANLRTYQKDGVNWLCFLRQHGFGGILADDMGLGKTLQALAFLTIQKQKYKLKKPNLVIAPTSVASNWLAEAAKFAPKLKCLLLYGQQRHQEQSKAKNVDLIITTYGLLQRDLEFFSGLDYQVVILDEAQAIKNASSKTAMAVQNLKAIQRITLTGTPIENSLAELWSQFNFLMPGFLGGLKDFHRLYLQPTLKKNTKRRIDFSLLRRQTKPFILRRMKQQVAKELPPKTEQILYCEMNGKQRILYEEIITAIRNQVRNNLKLQGFQRSRISIFDALLKLRQICCDPRLSQLSGDDPPESAKLKLLEETLTSIVDQGHRVLVFSQFVKMLKLIQKPLIENNIPFLQLDGSTKDRKTVVQNFQKGIYPVFLISLRAGGVGLNLTAADYVIHYDPWWNPAVEAQATDRAYRIGQKKHVHVYKLITHNSVEEKVVELQKRKRSLMQKVISESMNLSDAFTAEDIQEILSL